MNISRSGLAAAFLLGMFAAPAAKADGPSFSCGQASGEIEALICGDPSLAEQDLKLATTYRAARAKTDEQGLKRLIAEQRGWVKGRDECWKADEKKTCVGDEYRRRIAELQATYRLVPAKGPFFYACDGNPANEVVATFFETEPPTLIAERGDSVSLMFLTPAASGAKYQGRNESFWEHHGDATIVWGYEAPEMQCARRDG